MCDVAESCTGSSVSCPADAKSTAECRGAAGNCDVAETCDGVTDDCPADGFAPADTECRAAAGVCDVAETCTGSGASCPADAKSTAECRGIAGICDAAETCDGVTDDCPADSFVTAGTECRSAAGACDLAESCTGAGAACPLDAKSTAECRGAAGTCDIAETCNGVSNDCPLDILATSGEVCRPAVGTCDVEETCDGVSPVCPADVTIDTDGDGICDEEDLCPGLVDSGNLDRDGDGIGDACDPCTNLLDIYAQKAKVTLTKLNVTAGKAFRFGGILEGVPSVPAIDPATNGVRVVLQDKELTALVDVMLPGGSGWKANAKGTSFGYANKAGFEGITRVKVKLPAKVPGRVKFSVTGKNTDFATDDLDRVSATLVLDAPFAVDGQCGEAVFPNLQGGACTANEKRHRLTCR